MNGSSRRRERIRAASSKCKGPGELVEELGAGVTDFGLVFFGAGTDLVVFRAAEETDFEELRAGCFIHIAFSVGHLPKLLLRVQPSVV